jgi:hypothetical protein
LTPKAGTIQAWNDVGGGGDDADLLVDRHDQRVVDLEQVVVAGRLARVGHLALRHVERGGRS